MQMKCSGAAAPSIVQHQCSAVANELSCCESTSHISVMRTCDLVNGPHETLGWCLRRPAQGSMVVSGPISTVSPSMSDANAKQRWRRGKKVKYVQTNKKLVLCETREYVFLLYT